MNIFGLKKLLIAVALMTLSILVGIGGYRIIEGYGWVDAIYMTIITIGTVGFEVVKPLTSIGKLFTAFYIILNLCLFAFIISVITQYFFEGELKNTFKRFKTTKKIKKMENHIIVCGYGRNGSKAVEELLKNKKPVVVIEEDKSLFGEQTDNPGLAFINGNATKDEVLISAGIKTAMAIITTLPDDADNVFISLTARELNPQLRVIARASQIHSENRLKRAGANHVVIPEQIGGFHMANLITNPEMIHFSDLITGDQDANLKISEFNCNIFKKEYINKTLGELNIQNNRKIIALAFISPGKGFIFNPDENVPLKKEDCLILMGDPEHLNNFKKTFTTES